MKGLSIKVKKHARTHTPKAAKLSTCSPQQAGVRNYSSLELSFLYRGITSKKKTPRNQKYRPSALEISTINNKACSRQLGNFDVVTTGELGLAINEPHIFGITLSSALHYCPGFSSLCSWPCSQRFHTNHNAVDLQVPRVDQRTAKKKKKKKTSDRHHIDKKAAAEISCSAGRASIRGTRSRRAQSSPCLRYKLQACTAHAFTRNVGMHCACVHTNLNLMRGFVANPPPPSLSLSLSLSFPPQLFIHIKLLIIFHNFKTFQLQNEET